MIKSRLINIVSLAALISMSISGFAGKGYCVQIKKYEKESKEMTGGIKDLTVYKGRLYMGSLNRGIFLFDRESERIEEFAGNDDLPSKRITSITALDEMLYIGTDKGLAVFDGNTTEVIDKIQNVTMRHTYLGVHRSSRTVYAASLYLAGGLVNNDGSGWKFIGGKGKGLFNDVRCFGFRGDKAFFGSIRGAIYEYDGVNFRRASEKSLPGGVSALGIFDEVIYAGTGKGFYKIENSAWKRVKLPDRFASAPITDIYEGKGYLLVGTTAGVLRYGKTKAKTITAKDGLPSNMVYSVVEMDDSTYVGTNRGLVEIKGW